MFTPYEYSNDSVNGVTAAILRELLWVRSEAAPLRRSERVGEGRLAADAP